MKEFDVLVTESRYKHSLAIVRALGKEGLKVATCSEGFSPTKFSKYSLRSFTYTKANFESNLISFLKENKVKLVLPAGYFSNRECARIKKGIQKYSSIIIEDFEKMSKVSDKEKIIPILRENKIIFPNTFIINNIAEVEKIQGKKFAIKSAQEEKGEKVNYANSMKQLKSILIKRLEYGPQIVQEYILGEGRGFFAFCKDGKILQSFQHKRIRQYPESGGVSSCAESIRDSNLSNISKKLIKNLKWTGPVMLEYIFDKKSKKYYFIEMNAKFWGSYDLSASCGLNFARIPFNILMKEVIKENPYPVGKRFQWILPEDTLRIKTCNKKREEWKKWKSDLFNPRVKKDLGYIFNDPIPTIIRILATIKKYFLEK